MRLKPAFETFDAVVVGIWGSGGRKGLLSSLLVAVRGAKNEFLTVGRVGTGFSEDAARADGETATAHHFDERTDILPAVYAHRFQFSR